MNPISQITEFLPRYVCLFYVDYRDSLDEHEDIRRNVSGPTAWKVCMKRVSNGMKARNRRIWRNIWTRHAEIWRKRVCPDCLKNTRNRSRDLIYERNDSNPAKDLIRNSCDTNLFYSLGVEIDGYSTGCPERGESVSMACYKVRRALRLPKGKFDGPVKELVENASYGGELRIYFNARFDRLISPERRRISNVSASAEMWWWPSLTAATVQVITYTFPWTSPCRSAGRICLWIHRYIIPMRLRSAA